MIFPPGRMITATGDHLPGGRPCRQRPFSSSSSSSSSSAGAASSGRDAAG